MPIYFWVNGHILLTKFRLLNKYGCNTTHTILLYPSCRCGNFDTCYHEWWQGTSDEDKCDDLSIGNQKVDFQCTFCCTKDNCNIQVRPSDDTLYKPKLINWVWWRRFHLGLYFNKYRPRVPTFVFKTVLSSGYILILLSIENILASLIETCQGWSRMRNVK